MVQPNLSHLSIFAAVAKHSSFQRAAAEAGMSSSAVSHAIRGLEERLGVALFNRTTRSVALTEAGQRLLERLQPALRDVGDALEEMNNFRATPTGTLRINASRPSAWSVLAGLMPRFLEAYPDIQLELVAEDGLVDIVASGFDAGVRLHESVPDDMVAVRISAARRMVVVGAPGYFRRFGAPAHPEELLHHTCIRYRFASGRLYRWEFEKDGAALEVDAPGRLTLNDPLLCVRAAEDGLGLAIVFEDLAEAELADGRLVRTLEDWSPPFPGFMLYYPRQRRMSSALRAFIDLARAS
jgi:DNA-binding transcriptional LysR family regulator